MIAIDQTLYEDCLAALQHMEDHAADVPTPIRTPRWTIARKKLVLALMLAAERELADEAPMLLRKQA